MSADRLRAVLAGIVIVLLAVPVGGALWLGVALGESPCILCWAQRTSMLLIALVALFVVRYGPRPRYIGMIVLLGAWGTFMALRHSALHLARDVGQGFSGSILGAHTYTWAWVIHWAVLVVAGALLLALRGPLAERWTAPLPRMGRVAMALLVVVTALNALQAFASTGPPPYIGQSDPVRLSLDPRQWVWSMEAWKGPVSWRGAWTIPTPDAAALDADPATGPLADLPVLPVLRRERVNAALDGRLADLALHGDDGDARAVAVTDAYGVYVLDATLAHVLAHATIDPGYAIDISTLSGAAFLAGDTIAAVGTNKSYVLLRADSTADARREWRHFTRSSGMAEGRRGRLATVRARQQYVLALAYDHAGDELVTVGVPSERHRRLVVSRFDRSDYLLASEFLPRLGAGLALAAPDRSLAEYVVTGAVVRDGLLFAISAAHSTLLVIDLQSRAVTAAYAVPGIASPTGLAARGDELLIAQEDGGIAVVPRPGAGAVITTELERTHVP